MPVGVVLTIGYACRSIATATDNLLVECRWKKDGVWCYLYSSAIISDMSADKVLLSDMSVCTVQLYQTCMLGSFIQNASFLSAALSGKASGLLKIHQTCLQVGRCSHRFVKLVGYHPGRHLEYIKF